MCYYSWRCFLCSCDLLDRVSVCVSMAERARMFNDLNCTIRSVSVCKCFVLPFHSQHTTLAMYLII